MILLDTHIWGWYLTDNKRLKQDSYKIIDRFKRKREAYKSSILIWEVFKLHEKGKIKFSLPLQTWIKSAITKGILVQEVSIDIYLESCCLPGSFHSDPADQMIVATSRIMNYKLITYDNKIINYKHVEMFNM